MSQNKFFYSIKKFKLHIVLAALQYFKTYFNFLIVCFKTHLEFLGEMNIYFSEMNCNEWISITLTNGLIWQFPTKCLGPQNQCVTPGLTQRLRPLKGVERFSLENTLL